MTITSNDILTNDLTATLSNGIQYVHPYTKIHEIITDGLNVLETHELIFDDSNNIDIFDMDVDYDDETRQFFDEYKRVNKTEIICEYEYNNWGLASVIVNLIMYPQLIDSEIKLMGKLNDKIEHINNYQTTIDVFTELIKSANLMIDVPLLIDKIKQRNLFYCQYACNLIYYVIENL